MTGPGIVFVTQLIDPDDPVLGFTVGLVRALSERTRVAVLAGEVRSVPTDLGADVTSMGRERGHGRARRGWSYELSLTRLCRGLRPAVVYAHMCPEYVTLATPVARVTSTPTVLWFTHSADSARLRRAEWLADVVVTALPGSYPRPSPKVQAIGHSIDTVRFRHEAPQARAPDGPLPLLAVGRMSNVKGYPVPLRAVALARSQGVDVRLRILGPASTPAELGVRAHLQGLVRELGLDEVVVIDEGVTPAAVAVALANSAGLVNASVPGQADKVVFEAMACGRAPIVSSPAFDSVLRDLPLELRFDEGDHAGLARRITDLAAAPPALVAGTSAELRRRVIDHHSLDHWADEVVRIAASLHHRPGSH